MYCKNCNSQITDDMLFCPVCGAQIPKGSNTYGFYQSPSNPAENQNNLFCPGCGTPNPADSIYCYNCGMGLANKNTYKKKLSTAAIALICVGAAALIGCTVVLFLIFSPSGSNSEDNPADIASEAVITEEPAERSTRRPDPTNPPTSRPEDNRSNSYSPVYRYNIATDSSHSFDCSYPVDFKIITPQADHKWVTYALEAPDGTGYIYIGGAKGKTAAKTAEDFLNTDGNNGDVIINDQFDNNYCRIKTLNASGYHYAYFDLSGNRIRGFEVHYDSDQDSRYQNYINYMEDTLSCY